jgi:HD-GYP domain-containing protein (c-di-GMP phosphodiesterase class II)
MTSDRPYRAALPFEKAIEEVRDGAGTQFDPVVVEAFLELAGSGQLSAPVVSPAAFDDALAG